jgi:hypothetical protein
MRKLLALGLTAALALTVACSDSNSPASPMAPSLVEAPAGPTGPTSGAMLTGTVTVASTARTVSARDVGGLTISVPGTSLSTAVDGTGNFTLDGVPPGDVQIRITGAGVDVTLGVNGVQAGQTIKLKITVSGTGGSIDSDSRNDSPADPGRRELEGRIETIVDGSSLIVSGQLVTTDSNTVVRKGDDTTMSFADLEVGMRVHVKGTMDSNGVSPSLLASEIKVQNTNLTVPMKVEGTVAATPAPSGTCPTITFVLEDKNITVMTDSRTNFKSSCSEIGPGDEVEVMGRLQSPVAPTDEPTPSPGSTILADKIEVTSEGDATDDDEEEVEEIEFKGVMSALGGSCPAVSFTVDGTSVTASSKTSFKPSCNALKNGDRVEVKAVFLDGNYLATRVERQ